MKIPKIVHDDKWLIPYVDVIKHRKDLYNDRLESLLVDEIESLTEFSNGYNYYGYQIIDNSCVFREWLPNAEKIFLIGDFNDWEEDDAFNFKKGGDGNWELKVGLNKIKHKSKYKLKVYWQGGSGERIPAWALRVIQDENSANFNAQFWNPEEGYIWKYKNIESQVAPLIYEAHVGMASEEECVATFNEFRINVLPRIKKLGYNVIQLMAIQEHPYYGSFGYHVSSLFAVSSRFGTPEELKMLIDEAHGLGIKVIMDIVHSHAVRNEIEGLGAYDGTQYQFFHEGARGEHPAWDSFCYNYGKQEVIHFLLSNIKFWLSEYRLDGFRFDGVTSMMYLDHGLGRDFTSYEYYFDGGQDEDALVYLMLANQLMKEINVNSISVAEEMSGYPGLASKIEDGGLGFDYRLAMGIPDFWIKKLKEQADETWNVGEILHELTSKRVDEKTISYAESHDQALVGDKTIAFRLMDKEMYFKMHINEQDLIVDRGLALHKLIRMITMVTNGGGYLNFMGNEFGHPEWIDFPREGNNWSYKHAIRQWSLADREDLKYQYLNSFDKSMITMLNETCLSTINSINVEFSNENDQVIAFARSEFIFVLNFNPNNSFTDYGIQLPQGKYKYFLSSDELRFGGFGRLDEQQIFKSMLLDSEGQNFQIKMYLPARTGIILKKEPIPNVYKRIKEFVSS